MMPGKDHLGRACGYLHVDDKKKHFQKRFFLLNRDRGHLELYSSDPSVSYFACLLRFFFCYQKDLN